jgi:hypothetical protein
MDNDDPSIAKPERDDIEALIERWWAEHFSGSPVAQVTQAWNHALAAKEELKRLLQNVTSATAKE